MSERSVDSTSPPIYGERKLRRDTQPAGTLNRVHEDRGAQRHRDGEADVMRNGAVSFTGVVEE